ncbi:MAG: dihydropteroate synthase [Candidatus Marinimicrobia bacterium]|nr:dihydropteroate synthase [Candidatus Neomarinimicrobiota bacterium]|tara:strand:+ start:204 stop:1040 length:837 start_codon:yes stop_codon:yes gene_type:complete
MNELKFKNWLKKPSNCLIMGIVNTTPDSFSDGGKYNSVNKAIDHAYDLLDNGADIIDIGGESTRPGAKPVSTSDEIKRISPLLIELAKNTDSTISIDTYKSSTAIHALDNGAHLINDISGMTHDKKMVNIISRYKVPIVIMHMKGTPKTMQLNPTYNNIINEISDFLAKQANIAISAGVSNEKIIIDPGIGFGKTLNDNYKIIAKLKQISKLGFPVLVGPSRKSFIGETLNESIDGRLEGSIVSAALCYKNGAKIVRVHDVEETKKSLLIVEKIIENS